jgi:2-C-methyl-D-erythritol 4-phosphate cytidylyltransferase
VVAGSAAVCAAVAADLPDLPVILVDGGLSAALRLAAAGSAAVVVVHEAVRALAPADLLTATIATVRAGAEVAVPVAAVSDTIKQIADDGTILSTVDRNTLRTVQAPYCFDRKALIRLLENGKDVDQAWQLATSLTTVPGHADAFAIDSPAARSLAGQVLSRRSVRA